MNILKFSVLLLTFISVSISGSKSSHAITTPQCTNLSYGLKYGSTDGLTSGEVSRLQEYLASQGFLGSEPTGYFGGLTLAAVRSLQSGTGIESTGFVGPLTRAKIRELSCAEASVPPIQYGSSNTGTISSLGSIYTGSVNFGSGLVNPDAASVACTPGHLFNIVTGMPCPSNPIYNQSQLPYVAPSSITLITPDGGESFTQGSNMEIRWNTYRASSNVSIELKRSSSSGFDVIASSISNTGSVVWQIPANQQIGNDYRLRVVDTNNRAIYDESGNFSITQSPLTAKSITSFSVTGPSATGVISEDSKTIVITLPHGITTRTFSPSIAVTPNATVSPASGVSQNFSTPKTYTVRAQDGSTQSYLVSVVNTFPASDKAITGFTLSNSSLSTSINESSKTITISAPYGTNVSALTPTVTISANATVSPTSGAIQDFTSPRSYVVRAQNGSTQTYVVSVVFGPRSTANLITSFTFPDIGGASTTIDQTSRTITVNVPYGTNLTSRSPVISVSAGATVLPTSNTAKDFRSQWDYVVTAQDGTSRRTYTVKVAPGGASTDNLINAFSLNGVIGTTAIDHTSGVITIQVPFGTVLSRTASISLSSPYSSIYPLGTVARTFTSTAPFLTYDVTAQDGTSKKSYTIKVVPSSPSTGSSITSFGLSNVTSTTTIDEEQKIVSVHVPYLTNVKSLIPVISLSQNATVAPASGVAQDFSNQRAYTVKSQDGLSQKEYKVGVRVDAPSRSAEITSFSFQGVNNSSFTITNLSQTSPNKLITVTVPNGTSRNSLTPVVTKSPFSTIIPALTARPFISDQTYTVTAQDTNYSQQYIVRVLVAN